MTARMARNVQSSELFGLLQRVVTPTVYEVFAKMSEDSRVFVEEQAKVSKRYNVDEVFEQATEKVGMWSEDVVSEIVKMLTSHWPHAEALHRKIWIMYVGRLVETTSDSADVEIDTKVPPFREYVWKVCQRAGEEFHDQSHLFVRKHMVGQRRESASQKRENAKKAEAIIDAAVEHVLIDSAPLNDIMRSFSSQMRKTEFEFNGNTVASPAATTTAAAAAAAAAIVGASLDEIEQKADAIQKQHDERVAADEDNEDNDDNDDTTKGAEQNGKVSENKDEEENDDDDDDDPRFVAATPAVMTPARAMKQRMRHAPQYQTSDSAYEDDYYGVQETPAPVRVVIPTGGDDA